MVTQKEQIELAKKYHEQKANAQQVTDTLGLDSHLLNIITRIEKVLKPKNTILDIGCGKGLLKTLLPKYKVHGMDLVRPKAYKQSKKSKDHFIKHDLNKTPFPFEDRKFDCIVCAEVLDCLFEPGNVIMEASRLLSEDGMFIITVPNFDAIDHRLTHYRSSNLLYSPSNVASMEQIRHFSLDSLNKFLLLSELQIVEVQGYSAVRSNFFKNAIQTLGNFLLATGTKEVKQDYLDSIFGAMFPCDCAGLMTVAKHKVAEH